jgi:hypothetical protein
MHQTGPDIGVIITNGTLIPGSGSGLVVLKVRAY